MIGGGASITGALLPGHLFAAEPLFGRQGLKIGLQLGVVAPDLERHPVDTLRLIRAIGYRSVEVSLSSPQPALLRTQFADHDLSCTSGMIGEGALSLSRPGEAIEAAHQLGITDVVISALTPPGGFRPTTNNIMADYVAMTRSLTADDYSRIADDLNEKGQVFANNGLRLGYHNHNFEFRRLGKETGLEVLLRQTNPDLVRFEMDAGWVTAAGLDPVALLDAHPGRFTQVHIKDVSRSTVPNHELNIIPADLGHGVIDWPRFLRAASAYGIKKFYFEQDPPFGRSRLKIASDGYSYLSSVKI